MPDKKKCSKCGEEKQLADFPKHRRMKDGLQRMCKPCRRAAQKASHQRNRVSDLNRYRSHYQKNKATYATRGRCQRLARFGITPADYDQLLAEQHGRCAICRTDQPGGSANRFHVDHDHVTGKVRGLLCYGCNVGLGLFRDDTFDLLNAIAYLGKAANA